MAMRRRDFLRSLAGVTAAAIAGPVLGSHAPRLGGPRMWVDWVGREATIHVQDVASRVTIGPLTMRLDLARGLWACSDGTTMWELAVDETWIRMFSRPPERRPRTLREAGRRLFARAEG